MFRRLDECIKYTGKKATGVQKRGPVERERDRGGGGGGEEELPNFGPKGESLHAEITGHKFIENAFILNEKEFNRIFRNESPSTKL